MYKQIIIARKDLNLSTGKLAAQVSHGSMAFLIEAFKEDWNRWISSGDPKEYYTAELTFDKDTFEQWMDADYTKCVLQAKNKNQLLKAKTMAEEMEMIEGEDFFLIYDLCRTEIEPEEDGKTLTVIGFRPMNSEVIDKISKKYQLYR